jgi:dTDP-4-amino-4,6-dideoxygalactose transaminase
MTEDVQERILTLPLHPYMSDDTVAVVATALQTSVAQDSVASLR